jgi:hypothetical protein
MGEIRREGNGILLVSPLPDWHALKIDALPWRSTPVPGRSNRQIPMPLKITASRRSGFCGCGRGRPRSGFWKNQIPISAAPMTPAESPI